MGELIRVPAPDGITIRVLEPTVPTTAAPFHSSATHVDAIGMPVAFTKSDDWPYHPTPCCGAGASCDEYATMYCKACYEAVDPAFGNHPVEPYRPISMLIHDEEVTNVTTETTDKPLTTMQAVRQVLTRAKKPLTAKQVAEKVVPLVPGLKGKTPAATVQAKLYVEARKPDGFVQRVDDGFVLRRDEA